MMLAARLAKYILYGDEVRHVCPSLTVYPDARSQAIEHPHGCIPFAAAAFAFDFCKPQQTLESFFWTHS